VSPLGVPPTAASVACGAVTVNPDKVEVRPIHLDLKETR
jgi:hypothetical protein